MVRVYRSSGSYRIVVDGMLDLDSPSLDAAERLAREAILERLRAFLPPRSPQPRDPGTAAVYHFDLNLRRAKRGGP